ncbi:biotin-dependent carboxyltransferase family protein [Plantactinospora sp. KBS50]|uniref:5-oxoprolinase subunit C family protein n=1 Tax=Plantactinospora sp. KBS50 TaxID=2024580 RepID=UPI001E5F20FA|nr:biotin-dependent carboxyltransferase family protein [Plantactinospora sp. KBS50]
MNPPDPGPARRPQLVVHRPGLLSTVQDLGRPGLAHLAVPRSGAADPDSLRLANRLVGNPETAAGVETTLLGAELRLTADRWIAVTGAPGPLSVQGRAVDPDRAIHLPAGRLLRIGPAERGVRRYLAVAGGVAVPPVLGSRASDLLSGIGPPPLRAGQTLPLGEETGRPPAAVDVAPRPGLDGEIWLRLLPGPRHDRFGAAATAALAGGTYRVSTESNRIGVRLAGPAVVATEDAELLSEGMVLGSVQIPAGGQPLIFLVDHPTTGGYPVIGVVHPDDMWRVAQARPGDTVRFRWQPARAAIS